MKNRLFICVFALLFCALSVLNLALPKKTFSENENRTLSSFPEFSLEALRDGSYTNNISSWLSDHYPCRDFWVSVKTAVSVITGHVENGGVYLTRDGSYIDGFSDEDTEFFAANVNALKSFTETMKNGYNIDVKSIIAPTATQIQSFKLPEFAVTADSDALYEKLKSVEGFIDTRDILNENREEYIYYRTDHHWTNKGAYLTYTQYKKALGETAADESAFDCEIVSDEFYGTLFSRFGLFIKNNADSVLAPSEDALGELTVINSKGESSNSIYTPEALGEKDKYLYFLGGNDSLIKIETSAGTGRRLLLIKDSYANSLLPYLTGDFDHISAVDLRYYTQSVFSLIEEEGITDALVLYNLKSFSSDRYFRFISE